VFGGLQNIPQAGPQGLIIDAFVRKIRILNRGRRYLMETIVTRQPGQREWRRPELRKLPIATTAASGKAIISGNDGTGGGKGDVSVLNS
jgi:hypothetical protein